jgi:hypothetical protein
MVVPERDDEITMAGSLLKNRCRISSKLKSSATESSEQDEHLESVGLNGGDVDTSDIPVLF